MSYGPREGRVNESSYARCLAFLLASQGFRFTMEDVQANGRADIVARHPVGIYLFELKVGEPVDKALKQIREKGFSSISLAFLSTLKRVTSSMRRQSAIELFFFVEVCAENRAGM